MTLADLLALDPTLAAELAQDERRARLIEEAEAAIEAEHGPDWAQPRGADPGFVRRRFDEA